MIKTALITFIGAGVLGTGAHNFTPQNLHISAGSLVYNISADGFHIQAADRPDFAVTLKTKGDRAFTLRF